MIQLRPRAWGVLLHPTSLPGPHGIGTLGARAEAFVDWLAAAGARWWQVLPLGPTGFGDSPYSALSAFAGNALLVDPAKLARRGWLPPDALPEGPDLRGRADYGRAHALLEPMLRAAHEGFRLRASAADRQSLEAFCAEQAAWLDDYALFRTIQGATGQPWWRWPQDLRERRPAALAREREARAEELRFVAFAQWCFFEQWSALRRHAREHGVRILGDMPLFVSLDSTDVWAHQELFRLGRDGLPEVVAGVPPDYFSPTGQRWGNPLYRWERMEATGFAWWIERLRAATTLYDRVRIDHFRGLAACWAIPASAPTAETGCWEPAPGRALFAAVQDALGSLPVVAEDLGVITPDVEALRDDLGIPGMKVLHFALSGPDNPFLPRNYPEHGRCVVYTGTHDNDTTEGWAMGLPPEAWPLLDEELRRFGVQRGSGRGSTARALLDLALRSPALLAVIPMQDLLGLGPEARMNTPAQSEGSWGWRAEAEAFRPELAADLRRLAEAAGRC